MNKNPHTPRRTRQDIEGLRAVAVLAVFADHLFKEPVGGFIGVDVFFVISGFLITGILLREASSSRTVSFRSFYLRRAKRILPTALLVLSVTVCASLIVYTFGEARSIARDAGWAAGFAANWRFAILGTDYLNAGTSTSPLQHYWSLGVEEQFYLVWPWIVLAALFVGRKAETGGVGWTARMFRMFRISTTGTVLTAVSATIVISFAFAVQDTRAEAAVAYFSTFSRAWELGVGALLAVCAPALGRLDLITRALLFWAGLGVIAVSMFAVNPGTSFPGPWAAAPVAGAALVIAAGVAERQERRYRRMAWPLTNAVSRYIGRISFSLYLWHFPAVVLMTAFIHDGSPRYYAAVLILTTALSVSSFHLLEEPVRRSSLTQRRQQAAVGALALVVVAVPLGLYTYRSSDSGIEHSAQVRMPSRQEWTAALAEALHTRDWPALTPDPAKLGPDARMAKPTEWIQDGCLGGELAVATYKTKDPVENAKHCVYGSPAAAKTIVVFGDSTTMSYVPGIRAALAGQDWRVYVYTVAACSPTYVPADQETMAADCRAFKTWVFSEIKRIHPTMVVTSFNPTYDVLKDKATGTAADAEWLSRITATGKQVLADAGSYVLLAVPQMADSEPGLCITRLSHPADCATPLSADHKHQLDIESRAIAAIGDSRAKFVDTSTWFCSNGQCPAFADGILIRADRLHLTAMASTALAPFLKDALAPPPPARTEPDR